MPLKPSVQKIFRPVPNIKLKESKNSDVRLFLEHTSSTGIERALTEFAARVCYNSVKKLGSAPNFVTNVLKSGHLSTAEHASMMLPVGAFGDGEKTSFRKQAVFETNRYFDFPKGYVAGNMRSWFELMARGEFHPTFEYIVALFPDAFPVGSYLNETEMYEFATQAPVSVPFHENLGDGPNVYLLAVNLGELEVTRRTDTVLTKPWVRFSWLIEGVSRSLTHQLVRHRAMSFSQESQRYVDFSKAEHNYNPFIFPDGPLEAKNKMNDAYENLKDYYDELRHSLKKEDARFVLPNGAATRLVMSCNLPELLHFLDIRMAKDAQWEIRRLARILGLQALAATGRVELKELIEQHGVDYERKGEG